MRFRELLNISTSKFRAANLHIMIYLRYLFGALMLIGIFLYIIFTLRVSETVKPPRRLKSIKTISPVHIDDIVLEKFNKTKFEDGTLCRVNYTDLRIFEDDKELPTIYFITPTNPRSRRFAELTRLSNTLLHIRNVHWIVADDRKDCDEYTEKFLNRIGIPYTYLTSPIPSEYKYRQYLRIPRGVSNRIASIKWVLKNGKEPSVTYFGDDDNSYDLRLFGEIRFTKKVSMFPVSLVGDFSLSTPVVRKGKLVGFLDSWIGERKFPVDMGGFAVNLEFMRKSPNIGMPYKSGYEEDGLVTSTGLKYQDVELKANNCTEILVWHSKTKHGKTAEIRIDDKVLNSTRTNLNALLRSLDAMGVIHTNSSGVPVTIARNGQLVNITMDNFDSLVTDYLRG